MDLGSRDEDGHDQDSEHGEDEYQEAQEQRVRPRELPADLPRSLDDRKNFRSYNEETEYYDAWQGGQCIQYHGCELRS